MRIDIGYQGENLARVVGINVGWMRRKWPAEWEYDNIQLFHKRPGESQEYPVANISFPEEHPDILLWRPNSIDTDLSGEGTAQVVLMNDSGIIGKSEIYVTVIHPSHSKTTNTGLPEAIEAWLTKVFKVASFEELLRQAGTYTDAVQAYIMARAEVEELAGETRTATEHLVSDVEESVAELTSETNKWIGVTATTTNVPAFKPDGTDNLANAQLTDDGTKKQFDFTFPNTKVYIPNIDDDGNMTWRLLSGEEAEPIEPINLIELLLENGEIHIDSLPPVTAEDNGKAMTVKDGAWGVSRVLPEITGSDEGKALVIRNGDWSVAAVLPGVTAADNGKVLLVRNGVWEKAEFKPLPDVTSTDDGKFLLVQNGAWAKGAFNPLPDITTSDNGKILRVENGAWAKSNEWRPASASATLLRSGWNSAREQTVNVIGVTAGSNVVVTPAPGSMAEWANAGVVCIGQGASQLTFRAETTPEADLEANVLIT